ATKINLTEWLGTQPTDEGRPLFALKLGKANATSTEPRRSIVLAMNHHARELNTTFTGVRLVRELLASSESDAEIKALLETSDIYVVLNMNPDGLACVWDKNNMWRKNRHKNADGSF